MTEWKLTILGKISDTFTGYPFKSKFYDDKREYNVVRSDNIKKKDYQWDDKKKCWNIINKELIKYQLKGNEW